MEPIRNFITMFSQSIGVEEPWYIDRAEFSQQDKAVHIYVRARETARYACPICGEMSERYDNEDKERTWRHGDVVFYPCYVHCRRPRVNCKEHGVHVVTAPWARPGSRFTLLMESYAMLLMEEMPIAKVAQVMRSSHSALTRILHYWVGDAVKRTDLSGVRKLCIDETSHKRGQNYVTLVIDAEQKRVIDVEKGRDASTIEAFASKLEAKGGACEAIEMVASDMSGTYMKAKEDWFPQAISVVDRFHVKKLMLDAMEVVRRAELGLPKQQRGVIQRKLLMIPSSKCTPAQKRQVEAISKACPKTGRAYRMVQALDIIYSCINPNAAKQRLKELISWMRRSRLESMMRAALTLRRYQEEILAYFIQRMTNALAEGINSIVQAAKRKARGYPTFTGFSCMIYLVAGRLKLACGSPFSVSLAP